MITLTTPKSHVDYTILSAENVNGLKVVTVETNAKIYQDVHALANEFNSSILEF